MMTLYIYSPVDYFAAYIITARNLGLENLAVYGLR